MKSLTIDPLISQNLDLLPLVGDANETLERELGAWAPNVSAQWDLKEEGDKPIAWLMLSFKDGRGFISTPFSREDLEDRRQTRSRIRRIWGDLLQKRSHRLISEVTEEPTRLGGEEVLDRISDLIYDFTETHGRPPSSLKLPMRHAVALMKLGSSFWGDFFQQIRELGVRALEGKPLFGVPVTLSSGVGAELSVE